MTSSSKSGAPSPAPKTTTAEALLGVLSLGPMTGYEIKQTIQRSIGNFWSESFGQIYPALKQLEAEGAIQRVDKPAGDGTRAGSRYSLTRAGGERLVRWLSVPVQPQVPRNELLLKVFFGPEASAHISEQHVTGARARAADLLTHYRAIARDLKANYAGDRRLPYWLMTTRLGIAEARARIRWADETLRTLVAFNGEPPSGGPGRRRVRGMQQT